MVNMRWLTAALLACIFCLAQDQPDATFSTEVKVVNLLATVLNRGGGIVRDLTKDDFAIAENGRPQAIRYFSRETDLPLTLGLMVDTSMSQQHVMNAERGASFRFRGLFLSILWRRAWIVVLTFASTMLGAWGVVKLLPPR